MTRGRYSGGGGGGCGCGFYIFIFVIAISIIYGIIGVIAGVATTWDNSTASNTIQLTKDIPLPPSNSNNTNILPIANSTGNRVKLLYSAEAHNPTYDELLWFLHADKTDTIPYNLNTMVCSDFAELVQHNATNNNIKCGYVSIRFAGQTFGHACNVFDTTNEGLVFVDCTGTSGTKNNDKIVLNFKEGGAYTPKSFSYTWLKEYNELNKELSRVSLNYTDKARPMRLHGMSDNAYRQSVGNYNTRNEYISEVQNGISNIRNKWGTDNQLLWFPMGNISSYKIYWPQK